MNSLLKTMHSMTNKRNILVRDSLQKQLSTSVIEMESAPGVGEDKTVGNCEESMTLCSVIEAVFLHGLKDSLLNRMTEALSGPDFDAMPQPSFWGPLLVFSHRQMIDQIQSLTQVTTEVGYCRAWIRLALNEGLLASYFCSIRRDNSALKPYYNRYAFIRDSDLVDVAQRLIESLDYINFNLACNSSLLNFWSSTPLLIAGIWSPPMKSCPVFSAVDIAKTISAEMIENDNLEEIETASSIGSLGSFNSSQTALNHTACITEDEALKIILKDKATNHIHFLQSAERSDDSEYGKAEENKTVSDKKEERLKSVENSPKRNTETEVDVVHENGSAEEQSQDDVTSNDVATTAGGNSLIRKLGWSTSLEDCESSMASSSVSQDSEVKNPLTPSEVCTYDALIKSYHTSGTATIPNLEEVLNKYPKKEPIPEEAKQETDVKVTINYEKQLGKIPREKGLDVQNYSCFECGHSIGLGFSKAYVCGYTGDYYCSQCLASGEFLIPSRIIHNWDWKRYPVSKNVAKYLSECSALLDLKVLNPRIYMAVDAMAQLQSLRIQLNLLRAYLFTCREPIIESLQKKVAPKDYLYEHVHRYSVSDLHDIPTGTLAQQLQKVIEFSKNHVINCWLCSQKGFICEVCNNPKAIYPFDMESTFRCPSCNAVFHADCLNANQSCPKCERRRKRMDLPLLDMECTDLPPNNLEPSSPSINGK